MAVGMVSLVGQATCTLADGLDRLLLASPVGEPSCKAALLAAIGLRNEHS